MASCPLALTASDGFQRKEVCPCRSLALTVSDRFPGKVDGMDPAIWGALPHELVAKVLARTPLHEFFKFRSVCKSWSRLLDDAWFRKSFIRKRPEVPFLITALKGSSFPVIYVAYSATSRVWYHPFRSFLSQRPDARMLATAGGIVLWLTGKVEMIGGEAVDNRQLLVSNPLTKAERLLPSMSTLRKTKEFDKLYAALLLDNETNEYSVFVIHIQCTYRKEWDGVSDMKAMVFSSKKNCWEKRGAIPEEECRWYSITSVLHNKELYCLFTNWSGSVQPSLYRISSCEKNNDSSRFWFKIDLDLRLTGYHISAYLYQTGPYLSVVSVTKRVGITMIKNSRLQLIQGKSQCAVEKAYTLILPSSDTDYSHSICANETYIYYMCLPLSNEFNHVSRLIMIKQQWKCQGGEEERRARSSIRRGPAIPRHAIAEMDHVLQSFLYHPRLDVDV